MSSISSAQLIRLKFSQKYAISYDQPENKKLVCFVLLQARYTPQTMRLAKALQNLLLITLTQEFSQTTNNYENTVHEQADGSFLFSPFKCLYSKLPYQFINRYIYSLIPNFRMKILTFINLQGTLLRQSFHSSRRHGERYREIERYFNDCCAAQPNTGCAKMKSVTVLNITTHKIFNS